MLKGGISINLNHLKIEISVKTIKKLGRGKSDTVYKNYNVKQFSLVAK